MAKRILNTEKLQSEWESLSTEQRSPHGTEIILTFSPTGAGMGIAAKGGIFLPLRYSPDEEGLTLLM